MKCKMCGKEYCSKQNYEKHIKSGSCQVTYKCNDCQKIFKKMNTLTEHRKKKPSRFTGNYVKFKKCE